MKKSSGLIFFRKIFLQSKSSVFSEENEPNLISLKCVQRSSKILKIDFGWRWGVLLMPLAYAPGFLDCWAIGLQVIKSKMITVVLKLILLPHIATAKITNLHLQIRLYSCK